MHRNTQYLSPLGRVQTFQALTISKLKLLHKIIVGDQLDACVLYKVLLNLIHIKFRHGDDGKTHIVVKRISRFNVATLENVVLEGYLKLCVFEVYIKILSICYYIPFWCFITFIYLSCVGIQALR